MNILFVAPYYAPAYAFGGVVRAAEGLARALVRRGNRVTVLTTDALDLQTRLPKTCESELDGVRVVRVRNRIRGLRRYNLSTPLGIGAAARDLLLDADVLHLHEFRTVENVLVAPQAGRLGKPIILSPHGTLNLATGRSILKAGWDRLLSPLVARYVNHALALTQAEMDEIEALWPRIGSPHTRFSIIPNGTDLAAVADLPDPAPLRARFGLGASRIVLFMGRLHRRKGVLQLAQAFRQAAVPDTKLLLVGPDEGMRQQLEALGDQRIVLTGYLGGQERLQALAAASLFALPAVGEGLSMAVLEAMGAGLPVLLAPGCNLPDAETYGAGRIVEQEAGLLAGALSSLLADADQLARMGENARRLVQERFTWDGAAARVEQVYRECLTLRHPSPQSPG